MQADLEGEAQHLHVLVATPLGPGGQGGIDRLNDLIFKTIAEHPELGISLKRLVTRGRGSILFAPFMLFRALATVISAVVTGRADVLHIHLSSHGSTYRKLVLSHWARSLRLPYVVHVHGSRFDTFWSGANPRLAAAITRMMADSRAVIVLGKHWAGVVSDNAPVASSRIVVLPNAVAPCSRPTARLEAGEVRISFLGAIGERKGTPQLIEALGRLADRADWTATIAGNGDLEQAHQELTKAGIVNRVVLPGWLDGTAARDLIHNTDILVLPSFAENLPMSILEAMACGVAVVTTPVGAIPDVIDDGENGLLVVPGDVGGLTEAIRRLLDDRSLRLRIGDAAARTHDEHHSMDRYVARLAAIWRRAAKGRPVKAP